MTFTPHLSFLGRFYEGFARLCNSLWCRIIKRPGTDDISEFQLWWDGPAHPFAHYLQSGFDTGHVLHSVGDANRDGRERVEPQHGAYLARDVGRAR